MARDGAGHVGHFGRTVGEVLQVLAEAEYDGEWGAELVGDVGKEVFTHTADLLEHSVVAAACPTGVDE